MTDITSTRVDHTAKAFDTDLQEITRKVAEMGGLVERQIAASEAVAEELAARAQSEPTDSFAALVPKYVSAAASIPYARLPK